MSPRPTAKTHSVRITEEQILAMQRWRPRRVQLGTEWTDSFEGGAWPGSTLRLALPFRETLETAFRLMCGPRDAAFHRSKDGLWVLELKGGQTGERRLDQVQAWLRTVGRYVALRDRLDLGFALDYDRVRGRPSAERTAVGALRFRAKPLDDYPAPAVLEAAEGLAAHCLRFLAAMGCYDGADAVVAAPSARAERPYHLPGYLARRIAEERGLEDLSAAARTVRDRPSTKYRPLAEKLRNIAGSVDVDRHAFRHRTVLLVDDIYQSGTTLNYVAKRLYEAGASAVYGLICEKTSRDDDNVRPPQAKPDRN